MTCIWKTVYGEEVIKGVEVIIGFGSEAAGCGNLSTLSYRNRTLYTPGLLERHLHNITADLQKSILLVI